MEQRLLVISHGHPQFQRGGGENAAYAIHQHIGARSGWQSLFLAAASEGMLQNHQDLQQVEALEWVLRPSHDWLLFESAVNLGPHSPLKQLIESWQPSVIHWHHFYRVGIDALLAIRRWCPKARVVFTLHEFLALCPYQGQLLTVSGAVCPGPRLEDCATCLPDIDRADLQLREALMHRLMAAVDVWIAPSEQLAALYGAWGLDRSQIHVVEYALPELFETGDAQDPLRDSFTAPCEGPPLRFGVLGNVLPSKGVDLVLLAFAELVRCFPEAKLTVFGSLPDDWRDCPPVHQRFYARTARLLELLGDSVVLWGGYEQADVPQLMQKIDWVVMGSLWRENSPVVILEAKACRRPLLVPALGGMLEKVRHGVDGWHYTPGDPTALAALMKRCCQSRQDWLALVQSMAEPVALDSILNAHLMLYAN